MTLIEAQIQCPPLLHEQLKTVTLEAWDRITLHGEPTGSYTKILQRPNKIYADFLARLETAISHTVIGEEAKRQLEKLLAYENVNQDCQKSIAPIRETGTIIDYLKENLFWETPSKGPPRSPSIKTRGKIHLFPQILYSRQCCC